MVKNTHLTIKIYIFYIERTINQINSAPTTLDSIQVYVYINMDKHDRIVMLLDESDPNIPCRFCIEMRGGVCAYANKICRVVEKHYD